MMSSKPYIPAKVDKYINEALNDGSTVILTTSEDEYIAIIKFAGLTDWFTILSWYEGQEDYQCVNITGRAFSVLHKLLDGRAP